MRVYVLLEGEACEGGRVVGVFASLDSALTKLPRAGMGEWKHFPGNQWNPESWERRDGDGVDVQAVEAWEVSP